MSDLCLDRNYYNITNIRETIKINEIARYIKNDKFENDSLKAKLVTLALNVYIDTEPHIPRIFPKYLRKTITNINYEHSNLSSSLSGNGFAGTVFERD